MTDDFYIGKTTKTKEERLQKHFYTSSYGSETHLHRAIRKYGESNFTIEEVESLIPKDILDEINNEYQLFIVNKENLMNMCKENHKKLLSQLDELLITTLDKFLSTKFKNNIKKPIFKCDMCNNFNGINLKALAAHKRGCNRKNIVISNNTVVNYNSSNLLL